MNTPTLHNVADLLSPNPLAQAQLIRDCYARAGLQLSKPSDRPQYFECHGTGTQAGDAAESRAIHKAFFEELASSEAHEKLVVGGVKTVIGHTESTAGLAGIIKTSLALKHGLIPPNRLFRSLNPRIEPYYENLRIATAPIEWAVPQDGGPRRASVNR
jgi:hybrid polyketide synthase / nonribosomal peptide synthetase ACE1